MTAELPVIRSHTAVSVLSTNCHISYHISYTYYLENISTAACRVFAGALKVRLAGVTTNTSPYHATATGARRYSSSR